MKKRNNFFKQVHWVFICTFILAGCSNNHGTEEKIFTEDERMEKTEIEASSVSVEKDTENSSESMVMEPETVYADWSEYFNGLNGAAVVYDVSNRRYSVYNRDLALVQSSPCSTFKIISSLIALEKGIIMPGDSTRSWSGEIFWNEDWNKDIDFNEAFRTSCVWYYRQVIDDIGKDMMQKELEKLQYGNCDISDYSKETQNKLKQVMLVSEQERTDISIYGKTGMGKADGIVVDAWFTGFAEGAEGKLFFVYVLEEQMV